MALEYGTYVRHDGLLFQPKVRSSISLLSSCVVVLVRASTTTPLPVRRSVETALASSTQTDVKSLSQAGPHVQLGWKSRLVGVSLVLVILSDTVLAVLLPGLKVILTRAVIVFILT